MMQDPSKLFEMIVGLQKEVERLNFENARLNNKTETFERDVNEFKHGMELEARHKISPYRDHHRKIAKLRFLLSKAVEENNQNEVKRLNGIIVDKERAFKMLQSWPEVNRYFDMLENHQIKDLNEYVSIFGAGKATSRKYTESGRGRGRGGRFGNRGGRNSNFNPNPTQEEKRRSFNGNKRIENYFAPIFEEKKVENISVPVVEKVNNVESQKIIPGKIAPYIRISKAGRFIAKLGLKDRSITRDNYKSKLFVKDELGNNLECTDDDFFKTDKVIHDLLQKDIIHEVTPFEYDKIRFISDIIAVRKINKQNVKTVRVTLNCKQLNFNTKCLSPKYISLENLNPLIEKTSNEVEVIDIKDGFFNIILEKSDRPYTTFEFNGKFYWYNRLPQGGSNSPYIFDTTLKYILKDEDEAFNYSDDILILNAKVNSQRIFDKLKKADFEISKTSGPTRKFEFLGHKYDLDSKLVTCSEKPFDKLKLKMEDLNLNELTNRQASGILSSLTQLFRGKVIPLDIKRKQKQIKTVGNNWDMGKISLDRSWINEMLKNAKNPIEIPKMYDGKNIKNSMWTDASNEGIGIVINSGESQKFRAGIPVNDSYWINLSANDKELLALGTALKIIPPVLKRFKINTDNPAVHSILSFKNKALEKSIYAEEIQKLLLRSKISYVPYKKDKNDFATDIEMYVADQLSRMGRKRKLTELEGPVQKIIKEHSWNYDIPREVKFKENNFGFKIPLLIHPSSLIENSENIQNRANIKKVKSESTLKLEDLDDSRTISNKKV